MYQLLYYITDGVGVVKDEEMAFFVHISEECTEMDTAPLVTEHKQPTEVTEEPEGNHGNSISEEEGTSFM